MLNILLSDLNPGIPNTLQDMYFDTHYTDVTLATADDKHIQAHKVILSSFSSVFRNILLKNNHQKPLIYLKDIHHSELSLILKLIYLGQCQVGSDYVEKLLACAKDLQILGLEDELLETQVSGPSSEVEKPKKVEGEQLDNNEINDDDKKNVEGEQLDNYEFDDNDKKHVEGSDYEEKENTEKDRTQNPTKVEKNDELYHQVKNIEENFSESSIFECQICTNKFKKIGNLIKHTNSCEQFDRRSSNLQKQEEAPRLECQRCHQTFQSKKTLKKHIEIHDGDNNFVCNMCSETFGSEFKLKLHLKKFHIKTTCSRPNCVFQGTFDDVKRHVRSKHNSGNQTVDFQCNLCGTKLTSRKGVYKHKQSHIHLNLKLETLAKNSGNQTVDFQCNLCGAKLTSRQGVDKHKQSHIHLNLKLETLAKMEAAPPNLASVIAPTYLLPGPCYPLDPDSSGDQEPGASKTDPLAAAES